MQQRRHYVFVIKTKILGRVCGAEVNWGDSSRSTEEGAENITSPRDKVSADVPTSPLALFPPPLIFLHVLNSEVSALKRKYISGNNTDYGAHARFAEVD